jgi:DNA-binding MarR family transcriptional regulator
MNSTHPHPHPHTAAQASVGTPGASGAPDTPPASRGAQPQGCTNFKLRQLLRRVAQLYDSELAQVGLKTTQFSLLSHVQSLGPVRPVDLADAMTLDASTLTRNLKPLIAAGWLALDPGADGRSRLVRITDSGRAKRTEAQRRWRVAQEALNAQLGTQRVLALHVLIDDALGLLAPAAEARAQGQAPAEPEAHAHTTTTATAED